MTTTQTVPIQTPPTTAHEHSWLVDSRHRTSEGVVLYVRCDDCQARRVDLQTNPTMPPIALSRARTHRS